jgi:hypothetical protein
MRFEVPHFLERQVRASRTEESAGKVSSSRARAAENFFWCVLERHFPCFRDMPKFLF